MDSQHFDELARRLASGLSRRSVLKGLFGGAAATVVAASDTSAQTPCTTDGDCTASTLGPCCNAICDNGFCLLFSDDDLCTPGACFNCNGNTGQCEFQCGVDQICCNNECSDDECCVDTDCTDGGDCQIATCTGEGLCSYSFAPELCSDGCQYCNDGYVCIDGCPGGFVCCNDSCVQGNCCTVADCGPIQCGALSCIDNICGAVSLCPPPFSCCSSPEGDYCVNPDEGGCCSTNDCIPVETAIQSCFAPTCINGFCLPFPNDNLCPEGQCCCDDQEICSEDCCDSTSGCVNDHDCFNDECCCHDGTCSDYCCPDDACKHDHDCGKDQCCCRNGTCSGRCCKEHRCHHDWHCEKGECCCKDGSCGSQCCPADDKPSVGTDTIHTLPSTGIGDDGDSSSLIAGAAILGGAAAVLGKQLRDQPKSNPGEPNS